VKDKNMAKNKINWNDWLWIGGAALAGGIGGWMLANYMTAPPTSSAPQAAQTPPPAETGNPGFDFLVQGYNPYVANLHAQHMPQRDPRFYSPYYH